MAGESTARALMGSPARGSETGQFSFVSRRRLTGLRMVWAR